MACRTQGTKKCLSIRQHICMRQSWLCTPLEETSGHKEASVLGKIHAHADPSCIYLQKKRAVIRVLQRQETCVHDDHCCIRHQKKHAVTKVFQCQEKHVHMPIIHTTRNHKGSHKDDSASGDSYVHGSMDVLSSRFEIAGNRLSRKHVMACKAIAMKESRHQWQKQMCAGQSFGTQTHTNMNSHTRTHAPSHESKIVY